jgi:predicted amidophosphoribosyltransferase
MAFMGTTTEWNQFSQDAKDSNKDNKIKTVEDYCYECDKETQGWESTWYCPVDGKQWEFHCNECCTVEEEG